MSSTSMLRRQVAHETAQSVRELLLLWQHPETREILVIGRFSRGEAGYSFAYTRATEGITDFRTLPGLNDLYHRYDTTSLPTVFARRVMQESRIDFDEYLNSLGLDREHATPWEQIVHSGGERVGDTLQFMQVPVVKDGRAQARFLVNGIRHIPADEREIGGRRIRVSAEEHEQTLRNLAPDDVVSVEPEAGNPRDNNATVVTTSGVPLGWVPRILSTSMRELLSHAPVHAQVVRVGRPEVPSHLRLVLDVDVPAPEGFQFDRLGLWEPLVG